MPPFTQTLGPWLERSSAAARCGRSGDEMQLLAELEAGLPAAEAFVQHFSPTVMNALPFYWAGYRLELRYTYRLVGLQSPDALWAGLRGSIRREIRKARRRLEVRDDLGLDRFHAVWAMTFARQGIDPAGSPDSSSASRAPAPGVTPGRCCSLRTRPGACTACSTSSGDRHAAFHLLSRGRSRASDSGAGSLLHVGGAHARRGP